VEDNLLDVLPKTDHELTDGCKALDYRTRSRSKKQP